MDHNDVWSNFANLAMDPQHLDIDTQPSHQLSGHMNGVNPTLSDSHIFGEPNGPLMLVKGKFSDDLYTVHCNESANLNDNSDMNWLQKSANQHLTAESEISAKEHHQQGEMIAGINAFENGTKPSDKDVTPETILDELLQFTSMHETDNLAPLNTHHHDFVPLVDPSTVSQYNEFTEPIESNTYHQTANNYDTNLFYSNSAFSTNSYDNPAMAYDPMLYEISKSMTDNTDNNREYQELGVVPKEEVDSNPIYLDFNLNNNVEQRPTKKRKRSHQQQPFPVDGKVSSSGLMDECKYMEYINEKGVTVRATYLDTTEPAEIDLTSRKKKLIKKEKPTSTPNVIEMPDLQENHNIVMIKPPQTDANIVALKTVIDQFNEYKTQHILVCKPKKTKRTHLQTPEERAQMIEDKLNSIDIMPIEIPLLSNSSSRQKGRKQQHKALRLPEEDFSFSTIEIESTNPPLSTMATKNVFGELKHRNVPTKSSKLEKITENKKSMANETHMDCSDSQNYILPKQKAEMKQIDEMPIFSKTINDIDDESDSDDMGDDAIDTRKTLKCTGCRKIFITRRSLVKHEKRCEDSLGCQPFDTTDTISSCDDRKSYDKQYDDKQLIDNDECDTDNAIMKLPQPIKFIETESCSERSKLSLKPKNRSITDPIAFSSRLDGIGCSSSSSSTSNTSKRSKSKSKYSIVCDICNKKFTKKGLYVIHKAVDHKEGGGNGGCSINLRSRRHRSSSINEVTQFDDNGQRRTSLRCSTTKN